MPSVFLYISNELLSIDENVHYFSNILQKKDKDEEDSDEKNEKDDEEETSAGLKVKIKISSLQFDTVSKPGFEMNREYTLSNFILVDNTCAYITLFCN